MEFPCPPTLCWVNMDPEYRCSYSKNKNINRYEALKKIKRSRKFIEKRFIIEIREDIDWKVDDALKMVEEGRVDEGAAMMMVLKAAHPNYHTVQYGMGVVHAFREELDEAIWCFKRAIEIFPPFLESQFNLAVAYHKKLDIGNTIKAYQKVVEMGASGNPLVAQAGGFLSMMEESVRRNDGVGLDEYLIGMERFEKAFAYMEMQKWEAAIVSFKECLSIVKRHFQSYGNMGICYGKLGKKEQALAAFDKALKINPRYELAAVNRAIALSLKEGEKIPDGPVEVVDYSKDYAAKNRSYIAERINELKGMKRGQK